jgi:hypothetical protein
MCGAANENILAAHVRFAHGSFVVENRTANTWENCDLMINPDDDAVDFHLLKLDILAGDVMAISASKFYQDYPAKKYNPQKYPPLVMRIACDIFGHRVGRDFAVNE